MSQAFVALVFSYLFIVKSPAMGITLIPCPDNPHEGVRVKETTVNLVNHPFSHKVPFLQGSFELLCSVSGTVSAPEFLRPRRLWNPWHSMTAWLAEPALHIQCDPLCFCSFSPRALTNHCMSNHWQTLKTPLASHVIQALTIVVPCCTTLSQPSFNSGWYP